MQMQGLYTAMVTPLTNEDTIDIPGFIENIHFQLSHQVDGLVILGTTGEAPTLSPEEQDLLIRLAKQEINRKVPLVVGTGSNSTKLTIEKTLHAKKLGCDIALIMTPYYNRPTQEGIFLHFKAIAEAVDLPICIYNIPGRCGQNIHPETLLRLSEIPQIIGVKEASGQIGQISEIIELTSKTSNKKTQFSVLSGDDALTLPLMALGGQGVVSVLSNVLPAEMKALVNAASEGNFNRAREIHYQLLPIIRMAFIETNPIPIKAMMNHLGQPAGHCRLPLCNLQSNNNEHLKTLLNNYQASLV